MRFALALIGLSQGLIVSAAIIVFLSVLDIIPQLSTITGTPNAVRVYSYAICSGVVIGTFVQMLSIRQLLNAQMGQISMVAFGLFMGIFTGVFLSALAEVLDVFPILAKKLKISNTLPLLVVALAMGKTLGSIIYWITPYFRK